MTRGVRQIVRFNWPFYALAAAALAIAPPVIAPPAATGRASACPLRRHRAGAASGWPPRSSRRGSSTTARR